MIFNAGSFPANPYTAQMASTTSTTSTTSIDLSIESGELVILGTQYAGEMKKGVFTVMNYLMPKQNVLSMHCSANASGDGDVSLFFGLSGTGKTTLSTDPRRELIGDDEHCWTDQGIFNIEGGCYAKVIHLSRENEPEIYDAVRYGAVLENVVFDETTHEVNYDDASITENTRVAYPIEFIENAKIPCLVNTGWTGGPCGVGSRMSLKHTRSIIDAIHDGSLASQETRTDSLFGFEVPTACSSVPSSILWPRDVWSDREAFDSSAQRLADLFQENFGKFAAGASDEIRAAGPN